MKKVPNIGRASLFTILRFILDYLCSRVDIARARLFIGHPSAHTYGIRNYSSERGLYFFLNLIMKTQQMIEWFLSVSLP